MSKANLQELYESMLREIRRGMDTSKVTQEQLGKAIGVKQSAISALLAGKSRMNMPQYFEICSVIKIRPIDIMRRVEVGEAKEVTMPSQIEKVVYKSPKHLLAYCAGTQSITARDISTKNGADFHEMEAILDELVASGAFEKQKGRYVQVKRNFTYVPVDYLKSNVIHNSILASTLDHCDRLPRGDRRREKIFNFRVIDRLTSSQSKEIEADMWKVFEKFRAFQKENMANEYQARDMELTCIRVFMGEPVLKG